MTSGPSGDVQAHAQPTQSSSEAPPEAQPQPLPALPAFFPLVRKGCEAPAAVNYKNSS